MEEIDSLFKERERLEESLVGVLVNSFDIDGNPLTNDAADEYFQLETEIAKLTKEIEAAYAQGDPTPKIVFENLGSLQKTP